MLSHISLYSYNIEIIQNDSVFFFLLKQNNQKQQNQKQQNNQNQQNNQKQHNHINNQKQSETTKSETKNIPYLQKIFDFTLNLIDECAQSEQPDELVDKFLPIIPKSSKEIIPPQISPPDVIRTPGAHPRCPRHNVDHRFVRKHYYKK